MHRRFALLLLVLLPMTGCGRAENSLLLLDQLPDVASIEFEGNASVSDGTLRELMTIRKGAWWNPFREHKYRRAQLESDLNAILTYYLRHGYLRARNVDHQVREAGGKVHILIQVDEGAPVTIYEVSLVGLTAADPEKLKGKLGLAPGKPMDPFRLQEDRRLILNELADRGYWNAKVDANVQLFGDQALVFYRVTENRPVALDELSVSGTTTLRDHIVVRELSVHEGERLERKQLQKSQTRLLQSGFFSDARWDTAGLDTVAHTVDVDFRVRERKLHWWEVGVGISSEGQLRLGGEWGSRSILGSGMRFAINSRTDFDVTDRLPSLIDDHRTDLVLNLRRLFGTPWEGQPNLFYLHDQEIVVNTTADYIQNFLGAGFNARLRFGDLRNQWVVSLEQQWVFNNADSLARASDAQLSRESYTTRLLSTWVERDTRNSFFNPSRGSFHDATLQIAGGAIGGQSDFFKGVGGSTRFGQLPAGKAVWGGRFRIGYIWPPEQDLRPGEIPLPPVERVPTQDRFRLGGANTVRGYEQDALDGLDPAAPRDALLAAGGLAQMLVNLEVRAPLFWRLGMVGFLDAGNVWQDPSSVRLDNFVPHGSPANVEPDDLRYTYGLGLRLGTPVGPMRVDYAWKWNVPEGDTGRRRGWHVAIGQAF